MERQAALLDVLADAGVPFTAVAHHLSVASGAPLAPYDGEEDEKEPEQKTRRDRSKR